MIDDVASSEAAEASIDAFIERRASRKPDPDEVEPSYAESVRRCRARGREERLRERAAYHEAMLAAHARNFEEILRRHRVGLRLCEEALGIAGDEGSAA